MARSSGVSVAFFLPRDPRKELLIPKRGLCFFWAAGIRRNSDLGVFAGLAQRLC